MVCSHQQCPLRPHVAPLGKGALFLCDQALDPNRKASLVTPTTTTTTNTTTTTLTNITTSTNTTPGLRIQSSSLDNSSLSSNISTNRPGSHGSSSNPSGQISSHVKGTNSPLSLTSLKAAWKSLTSITSSSSKLPHLERQTDTFSILSSPPSSSGQIPAHQTSSQDYRYTQIPSSGSSALQILSGNKRHKDSGNSLHQTRHNTHIHLTPASRSYTHPHRSPLQPPPVGHLHQGTRSTIISRTSTPSQSRSGTFTSSTVSRAPGEGLTLAKCLRKYQEKQQKIHDQALTRKSKSDNALQKIGVKLKSQSDQNLHKVWLVGASGGSQASCYTTSNSIFSTVQLSGGSGDSSASVASNNSSSSYRKRRRRLLAGIGLDEEIRRREQQEERSRSLERNHCNRIHSNNNTGRHTRSLERNHKFRIDLRNLIPSQSLCPHNDPIPPDHLAPSPPTHTAPFIPNCGHHSHHSFTSSSNSPSLPSYSSSSHSSCSNTYSPSPGDICSPSYPRLLHSNTPLCPDGRLCAMEGTVAQAGSFINKPARGWLHSDTQLADGGVSYGVRYIGCLEVNTSMKSLNFDTRSLIAKECISRVCEAAGLKTADRRRKVMKTIGRILGDAPLMQHAGSNVNLTITSTALTLTLLDGAALIAHHDMPNISFASGGDPDTLDFIAYVAKDCRYGRACFVLECGGGQAQNVITSIGQAFELRFKEYLKKTPQGSVTAAVSTSSVASVVNNINNGPSAGHATTNNLNTPTTITPATGQPSVHYSTVNSSTDRLPPGVRNDDPEYYNDLPGKVPPDLIPPTSQPPPVPPLPNYTTTASAITSKPATNATNHLPNSVSVATPPPALQEDTSKIINRSSNMSALSAAPSNCDVINALPVGEAPRPPSATGVANLIDLCGDSSASVAAGRCEPEYVNDAIIKKSHQAGDGAGKDPFDMQPFNETLSHIEPSAPKSLSVHQRMQLAQELWYHGPITRRQAEDLLRQDGDFLVRESQGTAGQFVLTGAQNNTKKHLLLVDPKGVVRTKYQTFSSVSHLINYHRDNELPIVSAESALVLRNPVIRRPTPPQGR